MVGQNPRMADHAAPQHSAIIARDYQTDAARLGADALRKHSNTLAIIPTGGGKTVTALLTAITAGFDRLLILVHREELVGQWINAARLVAPDCTVSTVTAAAKNWSGRIVIAMVPTLCRPANLDEMPGFDLVAIDEAHHAVAVSWQAILETACRRRSDVRVYGCTATPERGDRKGLRRVFSNVSFALPLRQLVEEGHLVEPRAFAFDIVAAEELDRDLGAGLEPAPSQQTGSADDHKDLVRRIEALERHAFRQEQAFKRVMDLMEANATGRPV